MIMLSGKLTIVKKKKRIKPAADLNWFFKYVLYVQNKITCYHTRSTCNLSTFSYTSWILVVYFFPDVSKHLKCYKWAWSQNTLYQHIFQGIRLEWTFSYIKWIYKLEFVHNYYTRPTWCNQCSDLHSETLALHW